MLVYKVNFYKHILIIDPKVLSIERYPDDKI